MLTTSGQLFFRETGHEHEGRKVMMVVGLVAFKDPPLGEHQYTIIGKETAMMLVDDSEIDLTEMARGQSLDGMLTMPIWKV